MAEAAAVPEAIRCDAMSAWQAVQVRSATRERSASRPRWSAWHEAHEPTSEASWSGWWAAARWQASHFASIAARVASFESHVSSLIGESGTWQASQSRSHFACTAATAPGEWCRCGSIAPHAHHPTAASSPATVSQVRQARIGLFRV